MDIDKKHWISNGAELVQSGDLVRFRDDDGVLREWQSADHLAGTRVDSFVGWHGGDVQFARVPTANAGKPSDRDEWITDPTETIQRGDLLRVRDDKHSEYGAWLPADHLAGREVGYFADWHRRDIQFCRPAQPAVQPASEQPPAPTPDRGSKYHRTIRQTLPGDTHGLALTVDVYDVLQAFGVTCPALQHAIKKLLCAGLRGSKSAEQDISEAANSCRRAIELLEFEL